MLSQKIFHSLSENISFSLRKYFILFLIIFHALSEIILFSLRKYFMLFLIIFHSLSENISFSLRKYFILSPVGAIIILKSSCIWDYVMTVKFANVLVQSVQSLMFFSTIFCQPTIFEIIWWLWSLPKCSLFNLWCSEIAAALQVQVKTGWN